MIDVRKERRTREELESFIPLYEFKNILGVSWERVMEIVMDGEIDAYDISGEYLSFKDLTRHTKGLRVLPTDVRRYIADIQVR